MAKDIGHGGPPPRTALITGAGQRIGKAMAKDLSTAGFAVAIHANSSIEAAREQADAIEAAGGRAAALQADLADGAAVDDLVRRAEAAIGPLGMIVNNASVFADDAATAFDEASFDRHFSVHLKAPLRLASAFVQTAQARGGLIVNVIDQRVWALNPRFFTYTLSKSALWTATQTMAQAFAPHGIRVNAIGPGPTLANERQSQEDFRRQTAGLPLGRGPELAEFARTLCYLFETPSVTGQMIALDGGQHLAWETPDIADINE